MSVVGGTALSIFSPLSLSAAVLFFGAAGEIVSIVSGGRNGQLEMLIGLLAAPVGIYVLRSVVMMYVRADTPELQGEAVGSMGILTVSIPETLTGEVTYTLNGQRCSSAAREVQGRTLPRGARVIIERKVHGIAYVSAIDPLDQVSPASPLPGPETTSDLSPPER